MNQLILDELALTRERDARAEIFERGWRKPSPLEALFLKMIGARQSLKDAPELLPLPILEREIHGDRISTQALRLGRLHFRSWLCCWLAGSRLVVAHQTAANGRE